MNGLDELGIPYNNGFLGSAFRTFNPNSYNYALVEDSNLNSKSWNPVSNFVKLYKIHGSINWIKEKEKIVERDLDYVKNNSSSIIIYPTPQKDMSTLMAPYSDLFRMMQNNLLKPNSVLISMGYSFSDEHINRIIFNALTSSDFRLIIFGSSKHIDKIIETNNRKIWVINSDEENSDEKIHYFKNIVEKVLPDVNKNLQKDRENSESIRKLLALTETNGNVE